MAHYLLTGAAGFIGAETGRQLVDAGHSVLGVDNLNDYYDVGLKAHRLDRLTPLDGFQFEKVDIEDVNSLRGIFKSNPFDAVINLAARAGVRYSMLHPEVYFTTNVMGTLNLLQLMREYEVKKYILASTSSLYAGLPMPFSETLPVNTPISPYAASKKAAEVMAYTYHKQFDIDVSVVRYFTVYGPAGRPDMSVLRFVQQIDQGVPITVFGDGSQSRDFTYVDDIASGTVAALKPVGYEIINLGGGKHPVELRRLIQLIEENLGKQANIEYQDFHAADMKTTQANITKAKNLLDWEPTVSVEEGVRQTIEWYQANLPWSSLIKLTT